jgi:1-aminocyclopropane-1-carboxylate deaminase
MSDSEGISPIQRVFLPERALKHVKLFIKREDLVHGPAHGNKYRKLKYHIQEAIQKGRSSLITLGGAFSNHIYAMAYAGSMLKIPTVGYIRGETDDRNPTLKQARAWGMELRFIARADYKFLYTACGIEMLEKRHPEAYIIPMGGTHPLALRGMEELVYEVKKQTNMTFDYWACPIATGGTGAGLVSGLAGQSRVIGFNVLKGLGLDTLQIALPVLRDVNAFTFIDSHYGGIGKFSGALIQFIIEFYEATRIFLDPVYTGKMMFKLLELIKTGYFDEGTTILVMHTGGLQGIDAFNFRFGGTLPSPTQPG